MVNKNSTTCVIEKSKDDLEVIRIFNDNKWQYIGSKYSVKRDIDLFIKSLEEISIKNNIIVFGLGTGEHIISLLETYPDRNIYVFEPSNCILDAFETSRNYKSISASKNVQICSIDNNIYISLSKIISDINFNDFSIISYANYDKIFNENYLKFLNDIKDYVVTTIINRNTHINFSKIWFEAFLRDIKVMAKSTPINLLEDIHKNKPAVIVSAGPSLEKNVHLLKDVQDEFIIITGGRTLKMLLDLGIKPDYVCVIDPIDKTYELMKPSINSNVPLIFYEGTNPDVAEKYSGRKYFFTHFDFVNDMLEMNVKTLISGGSVAHNCLGLALHLGCDPIIFIGQDFAFTGEKYHADNAVLSCESNDYKHDPNLILVDDVFGDKVKTNYSFNMFRKNMEDIIKVYTNKVYVNSTEGGANISGTKVMPLKEALSKYSTGTIQKNHLIENNLDESLYIRVTNQLNHILNMLIELRSCCFDGIKLTKQLQKCINSGKQSELKLLNKKLNKIDEKLNMSFKQASFINFILYPVIENILSSSEYKVNAEDSQILKDTKIVSKSKKLYEEIERVLNEAIDIMQQNLNR